MRKLYPTNFGALLQGKIRSNHGTQTAFAKEIGKSQSGVSRIVRAPAGGVSSGALKDTFLGFPKKDHPTLISAWVRDHIVPYASPDYTAEWTREEVRDYLRAVPNLVNSGFSSQVLKNLDKMSMRFDELDDWYIEQMLSLEASCVTLDHLDRLGRAIQVARQMQQRAHDGQDAYWFARSLWREGVTLLARRPKLMAVADSPLRIAHEELMRWNPSTEVERQMKQVLNRRIVRDKARNIDHLSASGDVGVETAKLHLTLLQHVNGETETGTDLAQAKEVEARLYHRVGQRDNSYSAVTESLRIAGSDDLKISTRGNTWKIRLLADDRQRDDALDLLESTARIAENGTMVYHLKWLDKLHLELVGEHRTALVQA